MFVIIYFLCSLLTSYANLSEYDQRQTGDLNIQVDLKDVQLFAILKDDKEEYVNYDYAYDYSELTIKPQNRTTPRPLNGTSTSTERIATSNNTSTTVATTIFQDQTISPVTNDLSTIRLSAGTMVADKDYITTVRTYPDVTTGRTIRDVTAASTHSTTRKHCRKGYVLNHKGQCQLKMNTTENALLRLVKLSQKLKIKRENKNSGTN